MFIRGGENETPGILDNSGELLSGPTGGTGVATTSAPPGHGDVGSSGPQDPSLYNYTYLSPSSNYYLTAPGYGYA